MITPRIALVTTRAARGLDDDMEPLVDALTQLMSAGVLAEGQHLPAERVLAAELGVSRTTVKRAYDHLREAQNLSTHGRGGTVVRHTPRVAPELARLKG
ncbi:MAG TPA: winged helix-turn-helix domain-containing protein, partial [Dokdonella sp.]|nr:winged helix-turn-helix domain-containing protein [Dokdonella sp.]